MKNDPGPAKKSSGPKRRARGLKEKAVGAIGDHPLIADVVAATLVAAAAALRDPAKARRLASAAAEDIGAAGSATSAKSGDLWELALDVARRSVEAIGTGKAKTKTGKKKSKKDSAKAGKKDRPKTGKKAKKSKAD